MKLKISYIDPESIGTDNRLRVDLGDIGNLTSSILEKGLIQPITIDAESKQLVAGGRRLAAFKAASEREPDNEFIKQGIPVLKRVIEDNLDYREIELMENFLRKDMTWDEELKGLEEFHSLMVDKYGESGWSGRRTAELLGLSKSNVADKLQMARALTVMPELASAPNESTAKKKFKKSVERAIVNEATQSAASNKNNKNDKNQKEEDPAYSAMRWAANHYNIGDAIKGMKDMHPGVVHFAEVDPPYAIDLQGKKSSGTAGVEEYNEIAEKEYPKFLRQVAKQVYRILSTHAYCVWWYGPSWHEEVRQALISVGFKLDPIPAIWYKPDSGAVSLSPNVHLARAYEPFFIARKGKPVLRVRGRSNVFAFQTVPHSKKVHPTERPVELIQSIYQTFVFPGAFVCVPFLGSGNSLRAGYREGIIPFGWDLSEEYKSAFLSRVAFDYPEGEPNLEEVAAIKQAEVEAGLVEEQEDD